MWRTIWVIMLALPNKDSPTYLGSFGSSLRRAQEETWNAETCIHTQHATEVS